MRKVCSLLLVPLVLANGGGCFGRGEPIRVNVPVPVPCIDEDQVPAETPPLGPVPQAAVQAADLLAAKLMEVRGEARTLRALVTACIGDD